jgi:tRNA threonylcarbamoyladenosine modification (KEOPS) complex  Pcc1 subunit
MTVIELETEHDEPRDIAAAVSPDNTEEMETRVEDGKIVTRIEREDVESAGATADDYMRNLIVADELVSAL